MLNENNTSIGKLQHTSDIKRIAIIDQSDFINSPIGGPTTFLRTIVPELTRYYDVYLIGRTEDKRLIGRWTEHYLGDASFYGIGPAGRFSKIIPNRIKTLFYLCRSRRQILKERFDIHYFHQVETVLPFLGKSLSKKLLHIHGLANPLSVSRFNILRNKIPQKIYNFIFKLVEMNVDGMISVSNPNTIDTNEIVISRKHLFKYIPTCVDTRLFQSKTKSDAKLEMGIPPNTRVFGYIGRLSKKKGIQKSLHVIQYLQEKNVSMKFIIVGDGEYKDSLSKMCSMLKIDKKVLFVPSKEYVVLPHYYNAIDVFLMSSEAEGLPMVILEALSCGVPVITTDVGAIKNVIRDGYNGYITNNFSPDVVCELMEKIFSNYKQMTKNAEESIKLYSAEAVAQMIVHHVDDLFR